FYNLNYTFYDSEPGVIVLRQREDLAPAIERLVFDNEYYHRLADAQSQSGPQWVVLDGQCTQRVVDILCQMIENYD
ncbi:MAG: hypothetical protein U9Q82_10775, partial [Chloroflexota bacterium]|nr:hypothetical protein [Chloroflexota bacterium]